jgi:uncharacterized protein YgiM (DUF1202 family)
MKRIKLYRLAIILTVLLSAIALAAPAGEKRPAALGSPEPAVAEVNQGQFPYIGEITGTDLNVRSGPGMNYYGCGKISSPTRVVVVGQNFSWPQILPPQGSFSWIFKQYVQTDVNNPSIGVVNGDNVRVYAGADDRDAMVSDSVQLTLKKGQKVRILGAAVGDYYKISPPEGAALWTSSQYIKFIRKADEIDVKVPKTGTGAVAAKPGVLIEQVDANSRKLERYYELTKQLDDEKAKPLAEQDYSKIRAEFEALAADANSGKAGQYAKYALRTVARCELAKESVNVIENQKGELENEMAKIDKSREQEKEKLTDFGKYAIIGIIKQSIVYADRPSGKWFLIVDNNDVPLCYAEAAGTALDVNYTDYYGKKVGLVGEITSNPTSSAALIKFTEIDKMEQPLPKAEPNEPNEPKAEPNEPQEPNDGSELK